ncbi:NADPH-dependent FMN reductase [Streptomyces chartreusis]|uniref:NADPH-dependent FMN reductase n=1 Tax=Streptomyces chartreusis TaxID=1969 RepID=UPI00386A1BF7|nr:NAD(P)H-dependent oxidoreductase [Streptomyces chartreusis]WTA33451.1 NAD(P)H-dependent oxidoreductase [Streptomyces chartreusis]
MRIVTVVGNPKPRSRTYAAAEMVVQTLTGRAPDERIDLADLGAELLDWSSPAVAAALELFVSADLAVVASPTYKASYTGLLKLFLDRIPGGKLSKLTVVPLMVAADPKHALAGEVHLKPVLTELGASCPTAALFLLESHCDQPEALEHWLSTARPRLPITQKGRR